MVGRAVGEYEGHSEGIIVGFRLGLVDGRRVGCDGEVVGTADGANVG